MALRRLHGDVDVDGENQSLDLDLARQELSQAIRDFDALKTEIDAEIH